MVSVSDRELNRPSFVCLAAALAGIVVAVTVAVGGGLALARAVAVAALVVAVVQVAVHFCEWLRCFLSCLPTTLLAATLRRLVLPRHTRLCLLLLTAASTAKISAQNPSRHHHHEHHTPPFLLQMLVRMCHRWHGWYSFYHDDFSFRSGSCSL